MVRPFFLWVLFLSTSLEASMAQTVSQPQKKKSVQVAESATLDCTYDTSDTNYLLFWYKQQGGQVTLVILQEAYKQYNATLNRFSVNFQKAAKSFSLEISDSQLGDAATYFCALMEREVGGIRAQCCKPHRDLYKNCRVKNRLPGLLPGPATMEEEVKKWEKYVRMETPAGPGDW